MAASEPTTVELAQHETANFIPDPEQGRDESADAPTLERAESTKGAAGAAVEAAVKDAAKAKAETWFVSFGVDRLAEFAQSFASPDCVAVQPMSAAVPVVVVGSLADEEEL